MEPIYSNIEKIHGLHITLSIHWKEQRWSITAIIESQELIQIENKDVNKNI